MTSYRLHAVSRAVVQHPALLAGAVLHVGMYAQPNLTALHLSITVGYAVWSTLALRVRGQGIYTQQTGSGMS